MKKHWLCMMIPLIGLCFGSARAAGLELAVGGWQQAPEGTLGYKVTSGSDIINVEDDLNYDTENRVTGRLKIELPLAMPNIYLVAAPMSFEGIGSKSVSFRFGDRTFAAEAELNSELTLNQYDIGFYWGIPGLRLATADKFNVDFGLNVRIVDFSGEISGESASAPGISVTEKESLTVVIPMLYAAVQFMPVDRLAFEAEARGLAVDGNSFYSLTGRMRIQITGPAFVAAGYRMDSLDIDEENVIIDAEFKGPFVEVGLKF